MLSETQSSRVGKTVSLLHQQCERNHSPFLSHPQYRNTHSFYTNRKPNPIVTWVLEADFFKFDVLSHPNPK
jgi:hypothetical protein